MTTDYKRPGPPSKFWFAKATQLMARKESVVGDKVLVKTLSDCRLSRWDDAVWGRCR